MRNPLATIANLYSQGRLPRWLQRRISMTSAFDDRMWNIELRYHFMGITFFKEFI